MLLNTRLLVVLGVLAGSAFAATKENGCELRSGCGGASLCATPDDAAAKGAWQVGARTVKVQNLTVEVWYPAAQAAPASAPKSYDIRQWLPLSEQKKIPDAKVPPQPCDCFADLPIDQERGPYPVVLFAHGTGGFRTQTLSLMTHLASRGFVVLAADHPGLYLGDLLQFKMNAKVPTDLQAIIAALRTQTPALGFLDGQVALDHIGLIGHSAGGSAIAGGAAWDGVEFLVPMAAGGSKAGANLKGTLVLGGLDDKVVAYSRQQDGFKQSPAPKRLVGLKNAGHLAFSDLCALKNADGEDLVAVAKKYKIMNAGFATSLWDGCAAGQIDPLKAREIVDYTVAAAAEEALQCTDHQGSFQALKSRFSEVGDFQEAQL